MTTEHRQIVVSGIPVEIVRKAIKNLHLGVYPPHGRVRVAAPLAVNDDAVRLAVIMRLAWIKRQQAGFKNQVRQSAREYVSGESHFFFGRRYRLSVVHQPGCSFVKVKNANTLLLQIPPGTDLAGRERTLFKWYRNELRTIARPLVEQWSAIIGVPVPLWGIRRMKTKWGSCNIAARRIWLNLELAKKSQPCLEYVIVHEIAHFLVRNHNDRFVKLLDRHLPVWRAVRDELNASPLTRERWT